MTSSSTSLRDIRKFGGIGLVFFGSICILSLWKEKLFPSYFFGSLFTLSTGLFLFPQQLRPLYHGWIKTSHIIGKTITTLFMALAYYSVITPATLLKKVLGGPPLPLRPEKTCPTYWVNRKEKAQPKERFFKRF
jgi:hypothetical protein